MDIILQSNIYSDRKSDTLELSHAKNILDASSPSLNLTNKMSQILLLRRAKNLLQKLPSAPKGSSFSSIKRISNDNQSSAPATTNKSELNLKYIFSISINNNSSSKHPEDRIQPTFSCRDVGNTIPSSNHIVLI